MVGSRAFLSPIGALIRIARIRILHPFFGVLIFSASWWSRQWSIWIRVFLQIHPFCLVFCASCGIPSGIPMWHPPLARFFAVRTMDHQGLSPGRVPLPNMDPWGHPVPISTFHEWMNYGFSMETSDFPVMFQWFSNDVFKRKKRPGIHWNTAPTGLQYSGGTSWALMASGKPSGPQCESNRRGNWPSSDHRDKLRIGCCSPIKTVHLCRKFFFLNVAVVAGNDEV